MIDGDPLYPEGFHPADNEFTESFEKLARPLRRSDVSGVRYYFIDFGISLIFDDPKMPRIASGADGIDRDVPELQHEEYYDPFAADIFILGNLFRKTFVKV